MLSEGEIRKRLNESDPERQLIITPLLDSEQVGPASVDLRLGTRFKVDLRTREPVLDSDPGSRPVASFFDETYRDFGERFVLYPGQVVLGATFEYVRLPKELFGILSTRSSWNRLGISSMSIVQPGYTGTLTLDLMNHGSNTVALYPGLRVVQLALIPVEGAVIQDYIGGQTPKYVADVGPKVSAVASDAEWKKMHDWRPMTSG